LFTILHISDLHRSREEPVDNDSLIAALLCDSDRYLGETPAVPQPGAITSTALLMLFFGQRMAKDYTGAAALIPYFILAGSALCLMGIP